MIFASVFIFMRMHMAVMFVKLPKLHVFLDSSVCQRPSGMCSEGGMVVIKSPKDFTLIHAVGT